LRKYIANDVADPRIAAANRHICSAEVGIDIGEAADATYRYLGLVLTLADGNGTATVSINAAVTPAKPHALERHNSVLKNLGRNLCALH
jgi:hypothetical protein